MFLSFRKKQALASAKEAAGDMDTNIHETEKFTLPSGQEVSVNMIMTACGLYPLLVLVAITSSKSAYFPSD